MVTSRAKILVSTERARSLSPIKDTSSNAGTPSSVRSRNDSLAMENLSRAPSIPPPASQIPSMDDTPRKANGVSLREESREIGEASREPPQPRPKPQIPSNISSSAASAHSRAGTLSWQQRPQSRSSVSSTNEPSPTISSNATTVPSSKRKPESPTPEESVMSRGQIVESLGLKDPAWFKQSQDRGLGSAALRKSRHEGVSGMNSQSVKIDLPGMSRESTSEPEKSPPPERVRADSPSTVNSSYVGSGYGSASSGSNLPSSTRAMNSPTPTIRNQKPDPSMPGTRLTHEDKALSRDYVISPTQSRFSPERTDRPASPTKGLGGFVQSAMMKRSDSVSKRWSAQTAPGLSRGNSIASNRSGFEAPKYSLGSLAPLGEPKPARFSRESTPASTSSRPSSSHSTSTVTPSQPSVIDEVRPAAKVLSSALLSSAPPDSSETENVPTEKTRGPTSRDSKSEPLMSPPTSPSKRWSPQKSSWLENAINKPESPKVISPAMIPQQPSWMASISRAKQQRGSVDLSKGPIHKEVATAGLMRSPSPNIGPKPPNIGGLPSVSSAIPPSREKSGSSSDLNKTKGTPESASTTSLPSSKLMGHISKTPPVTPKSLTEAEDSPSNVDKSGVKATSPKDGETKSQMDKTQTQKPKPETPPKKDFRSTLKSRSNPVTGQREEEPEFRNVVGKLKRTQTQNYKAPNELKENIMRGKAGLTVTGGPKKTEQKDEFKESIVKKKQGMVAPSASTRISGASNVESELSTPEAIRRRQALNKSDEHASTPPLQKLKHETSKYVENTSKHKQPLEKPKETPPPKPALGSTAMQKGINPSRGGDFSTTLAGILEQGPSPMTDASKASDAPKQSSNAITQSVEPAARDGLPQPGPQLIHATKSRARGPKRKLPTVAKQESSSDLVEQNLPPSKAINAGIVLASSVSGELPTAPPSSKSIPRPLQNITHSNNDNRKTSLPAPPRKPSTSINQQPQDLPAVPKPQLTEEGSKPNAAVTSNIDSRVREKRQSPSIPPPQQTLQPSYNGTNVDRNQEPISGVPLLSTKATGEEQEGPLLLPSVKGAAALWNQQPKPKPESPKSPIKLPTRRDEQAKMQGAGFASEHPAVASAKPSLNAPSLNSPKPNVNNNVTRSPKSPPLPGKKPLHVADTIPPIKFTSPSSPPTISLQQRSSDTAQFLSDIFDESPGSKTNPRFDTHAILNARSAKDSFPKIKTLRKQIVEVIGNGKTAPVPPHQEHILFEDSLYLCTHVFGTLAGQRMTEVYLWCGAGASPSLIDDAQIFAKKVAKDNNGRLIVLRHGQETSSFFQALGGIVITRRGSTSRADSSPGQAIAYMLCGRQHIGQIAFDEVDYSSRSLCSSFPYILATTSGKIYLWKGKGASTDELGCARLIGMDLGYTGEIDEIDEGQEPKAFWSEFAKGGRPETARHWHLKPSCEGYILRLFSVDCEPPRPKSASSFIQWGRRGSAPANDPNTSITAQIKELMPFSHADLVDDNIFILDAFFEIFV